MNYIFPAYFPAYIYIYKYKTSPVPDAVSQLQYHNYNKKKLH